MTPRVYRWVTRALGLAALLGALGSLVVGRRLVRRYRTDMTTAYDILESAPTAVVETTYGSVEYQQEGDGEGVHILVAHGIVGGFDQAIHIGRSLVGDEGTIIGVSRFGYLGSDIPEDPTPRNQAAAYSELLDEMGVEKVVVVGTSAGGAPALQFALMYPDRTSGLVLLGAATPSDGPIDGPMGPPEELLRDPVFWALVRLAPQALRAMFGVDEQAFEAGSAAERESVRDLFSTLLPVEPRRPGIRNDTEITNTDVGTAADTYDLESLQVPTLVLHAEDDPLASVEDAERLAELVPDCEFKRFPDGGHLLFGHSQEVMGHMTEFLDAVSPEKPQ